MSAETTRVDPHPPVAVGHPANPALQRVIVSVGDHTVGADLHLLAADSRPPVVFIHGIMASLGLAAELFAAPDRESWIALSLPGHHPGGFSPGLRPGAIDAALFGEIVESALERLVGGRRVIAVGWSAGGFAAVNLAIRHPRRVAAVASLAGFASGRLTGIIGWMQWLAGQPGGREILRRLLAAGGRLPALHDAIVRLCAADRAAGAALSAPVLSSMRRDFARHDPAAIAMLLAALPAIDIGDRLAEVRVPTWVAAGGRDPIVPLAQTLRLARGIPGAELRVYEPGGHLFFSEWPGFRADFTAWRESLPAAGGGAP
jgi:pimeloyl-ACP methyl ester carboxylesterase